MCCNSFVRCTVRGRDWRGARMHWRHGKKIVSPDFGLGHMRHRSHHNRDLGRHHVAPDSGTAQVRDLGTELSLVYIGSILVLQQDAQWVGNQRRATTRRYRNMCRFSVRTTIRAVLRDRRSHFDSSTPCLHQAAYARGALLSRWGASSPAHCSVCRMANGPRRRTRRLPAWIGRGNSDRLVRDRWWYGGSWRCGADTYRLRYPYNVAEVASALGKSQRLRVLVPDWPMFGTIDVSKLYEFSYRQALGRPDVSFGELAWCRAGCCRLSGTCGCLGRARGLVRPA